MKSLLRAIVKILPDGWGMSWPGNLTLKSLTNLCDAIHFLENGKIKFSRSEPEFAAYEKELFKSIEEKNLTLVEDLTKQ